MLAKDLRAKLPQELWDSVAENFHIGDFNRMNKVMATRRDGRINYPYSEETPAFKRWKESAVKMQQRFKKSRTPYSYLDERFYEDPKSPWRLNNINEALEEQLLNGNISGFEALLRGLKEEKRGIEYKAFLRTIQSIIGGKRYEWERVKRTIGFIVKEISELPRRNREMFEVIVERIVRIYEREENNMIEDGLETEATTMRYWRVLRGMIKEGLKQGILIRRDIQWLPGEIGNIEYVVHGL